MAVSYTHLDVYKRQEQFKQIQDVAGMETIEDYIYYATMSHCKTMQAASKICLLYTSRCV